MGRESGGVYRVKRKFHCVVKRDAVGWVSRSRSRERERERERTCSRGLFRVETRFKVVVTATNAVVFVRLHPRSQLNPQWITLFDEWIEADEGKLTLC